MSSYNEILGYQQITGLSTAKGLTVPVSTKTGRSANIALISCEAQNVRWRDDGIAPTASVGQQMLTTDPIYEYHGDLSNIQFIEETTGGKVNVCYYTEG